ncbi:MAG: cupin domain-containing protein [Deltaproteobacteria bacterium]|nr:MAG: cupin domain-containing protein [Deltaproteobacteria bacterium]
MKANLYDDDAAPPEGERFEVLRQVGPVVIERIVSSASPGPGLYVQAQDEWVVLVRGTAVVELDGEPHALAAGDHLFIPARTPHRVRETSAGALWLAVHVHPDEAAARAAAEATAEP